MIYSRKKGKPMRIMALPITEAMVNFRPNFFDASEKASTIFCISSAECATSALSSANSSSIVSIRPHLQVILWKAPD